MRLVATPENGSSTELRPPSHAFSTASRSEISSCRIVPSWTPVIRRGGRDRLRRARPRRPRRGRNRRGRCSGRCDSRPAEAGAGGRAGSAFSSQSMASHPPRQAAPVPGSSFAFSARRRSAPRRTGPQTTPRIRRGKRDLERPSRLGDIQVAHDRRPCRDRQEARTVVQVLPRDLAQLGRAGKRQGDPETPVLGPRVSRATSDTARLTSPSNSDVEQLGRRSPSRAPSRATRRGACPGASGRP